MLIMKTKFRPGPSRETENMTNWGPIFIFEFQLNDIVDINPSKKLINVDENEYISE